ncbi:hypothetical protein [Roseovarius amoyensis]|uniref:hypothetical protein n=1 Tax=Roseovarius amoyensis TaxID=2211448 RepID=UPI0013A6CB58|nr:hypothetical protein [Roseovarius amoyensis]
MKLFTSTFFLALCLQLASLQASDGPVTALLNRSCTSLAVDWKSYRNGIREEYGSGGGYDRVFYGPNLMSKILDDFMRDLEGDQRAIDRIRPTLKKILYETCLTSIEDERLGQSAREFYELGDTAQDVLEKTLHNLKLDRSKFRWGLHDLPPLDFSIHSYAQYIEFLNDVPDELSSTPVDNILMAAWYRYKKGLDLKAKSDFIEAERARTDAFNWMVEEDPQTPLKEILDRLAIERGLRLK